MRNIRFHYKLFVTFSAVIALLFIISGTIFFRVTVSALEENFLINQQQVNQKIAEQIESIFNEMNRLSIAVNASEEIRGILSSAPLQHDGNFLADNPRYANRIKETLFSILQLTSFEYGVLVMTPSFDSTGHYHKFSVINDKGFLRYETDFKQMMESDKYLFIITPDEERVFHGNDFFAIFRPLRDLYSVWGGVYVGLPVYVIDNLCRTNYGILKTIIYDENGRVLYSNLPDMINDQYDTLWRNVGSGHTGTFVTESGEIAGFTCVYTSIRSLGWFVMLVEYSIQHTYPVQNMRQIVITSYVLAFVAILILLYFLLLSLTKPIRNLTERIANADLRKPVISIKDTPTNEIDILGKSFQTLIDTLAETNRNLIDANVREMTAHISTLQAQMNPHFLYNTLSVISAHGKKSNCPDVVKMCADLSNMLRYSAEITNETTLSMEVKNTGWYLNIMRCRYAGCLEYDVDVDPLLHEVKVPKLIIQPIVENSFVHGFKETPYPWCVKVRGFVDNGNWVIRVEDNGSGFSDEALKKLNLDLNKTNTKELSEYIKTTGRGIGLVNTFMRLRYFYNGIEKINCYNANSGGAIIEIGGPLHVEHVS